MTQKHSICMISDFFYPNVGGVENHIYQLSQQLIARGHYVVMVTHHYGNHVGIRYISNYMKVYYLPFPCVYMGGTFPLLIATLPLLRDIIIREGITIIHGHGSYSGFSGEGMLHGSAMGIPVVFTDHSLFGFSDINSLLTNKLLECFTTNLTHVICVSHTSKENNMLRTLLPSDIISVIPNAIDGHSFTPDETKRQKGKITIVVVSRLVYRKGADFLAAIIPIICKKHKDVQFIIGGDGNKRVLIEEVREKHMLEDRVIMKGMIPHAAVRDVLVQGDIFLNTSITEAFCIAIVEAACCGLQVVSTNVGGVPEVLPPDLIHLVDPSVSGLIAGLDSAICAIRNHTVLSPMEIHERVRDLYTWSDVAERTERIYDRVVEKKMYTYYQLIQRFRRRSSVAGILYVMTYVAILMAHIILNWYRPAELIDRVPSELKLKQTKAASQVMLANVASFKQTEPT